MRMRIAAFMVLVTAANLLLTPIDVDARGGGRGGGGGRGSGGRGGGGSVGGRGGGAYRGGKTMNRTPTMSRATSRPAASQARRQTRPTASQGRVQQSRPIAQQRPSGANRAQLNNQLQRYAQNRPAQNIDRQALGQRAQNFSNYRGNQVSQNRQLSDRLSQRVKESRPNSNHWFDQNFFHRHNIDLDYVRSGANWWRPAAWSTLAAWGSWGWSTPYYYDDNGYAYSIPITESSPSYSSYPSYTSYPNDTDSYNTTPSV